MFRICSNCTDMPPSTLQPARSDIDQRAPSPAPVAGDVARGIMRLFGRNDTWLMPEIPLRNARRADLMGIDGKGKVVIVEIKVSRADLMGDGKWPDYLDYCDRFYWGLPPQLDCSPLDSEISAPIVAA